MNNGMAPDQLYSPSEVARSLRVSAATISRAIHGGKLRAYRVGNQWRIAGRDVLDYVTAQTEEALRDGLVRAVDQAANEDLVGNTTAGALRFAAEHLPLGLLLEVLRGASSFLD